MNNFEQYKMARAFAREYGVFLGISWCATFCFMVYGMSHFDTPTTLIGIFLYILLPFIACYLSWRFKQHLPAGEQVSTAIAFMFAFFMLINACIITAVIEFCYFKFFDGGEIIASMKALVTADDIVRQYKAMGMSQMLETMNESLDMFAGLSPFDITVYLFSNNIFTSFFLIFPTAYLAHRKSKLYRKIGR